MPLTKTTKITEYYYTVNDETALSKRHMLDDQGILYPMLLVQPVLVIIMVIVTIFFYGTPVDKGFRLVSLLVGVEKDSVDILQGAALSGSLQRPVSIDFMIMEGEIMESKGGQLRYSLEEEAHEKPKLERRVRYS